MTWYEEVRRFGLQELAKAGISITFCYVVLLVVVTLSPILGSMVAPSSLFLDFRGVHIPDHRVGENPTVVSERRPWPVPLGKFGRRPITAVGSVEIWNVEEPGREICQGMGQYKIDLAPPDRRYIRFDHYTGDPRCRLLEPGTYRGRTEYEFVVANVAHSVGYDFEFRVLPR